MNTKFDIDETILLPAKVKQISIDNRTTYYLNITVDDNKDCRFWVDEDVLIERCNKSIADQIIESYKENLFKQLDELERQYKDTLKANESIFLSPKSCIDKIRKIIEGESIC